MVFDVAEKVAAKPEKWRGRYKTKPTGRPKGTTDYRLSKLLEESVKYIEDVVRGVVKEPNATRLTLSWKIIERYGGVEIKGKKVSGIEAHLR